MELNELKVIVTGGASGLGEHFTKRLYEAGAQVAVGAADGRSGPERRQEAVVACRATLVALESRLEPNADLPGAQADRLAGLAGLADAPTGFGQLFERIGP